MSKDNFRYGMSRILMTNERDPDRIKQSEMRLNIKPVREYIKNYFDEVYDEGIL